MTPLVLIMQDQSSVSFSRFLVRFSRIKASFIDRSMNSNRTKSVVNKLFFQKHVFSFESLLSFCALCTMQCDEELSLQMWLLVLKSLKEGCFHVNMILCLLINSPTPEGDPLTSFTLSDDSFSKVPVVRMILFWQKYCEFCTY